MQYKNILSHLEDLKCEEIKIYDFKKTSPFYDYFIIATANPRKANALCLRLKKDENIEIKSIENKDPNWVLVDGYNVIVHLFTSDARIHYNLDTMLNKFLIKTSKND